MQEQNLHHFRVSNICFASINTMLMTSLFKRFNWLSDGEIVYFTTHGIEIYSVLPEKRIVKSFRHLNQLMTWFVFCPISSVLVVSSSKSATCINLFHLKSGNILKLPRIDADLQPTTTTSKVEVKEKDIQGLSYLSSTIQNFLHSNWIAAVAFVLLQSSLCTMISTT